MAKTKKAVQSSNDNVEEVNGASKPAATDERKPAKDLKNNFKSHANQNSVRDMVTNALKAKASAEGVALTTIRKYITDNYNNKRKLGKALQKGIKDYIEQQFEKGAIVAANTKDKNIKFNVMRFNMADK